MKKLTAVLFLLLTLTGTASADQSGGAAPLFADALEGGVCQDEGVLNDIQAAHPLICTNSVWRKVVFKDDGKGVTEPIFYEGKCSVRFTDEKDTKGKITLKTGEIADICLPVGWRAIVSSTTNSVDWVYHNLQSLPNVVLVKAARPGAKSMLWIYPKSDNGKSPQKFEIELRSSK